MQTKFKMYYTFLALLTLGMIAHTIFVGSQSVSYGMQIHQLEAQKQATLNKEQALRQQIEASNSIAFISTSALNEGYVAIDNLVPVAHTTTVAMRQ